MSKSNNPQQPSKKLLLKPTSTKKQAVTKRPAKSNIVRKDNEEMFEFTDGSMKVSGKLKADDVMKLAKTSQRHKLIYMIGILIAIIVLKEQAWKFLPAIGIEPALKFIRKLKLSP